MPIIFLCMNKNNDHSFGKRLAALRKARGLSQRDLAKLTGVSNRMIAYYEAQSDRPPATKLATFAEVLKVSTDELLGIEPLHVQEPANSRLWKRLKVVETLPPKAQKQVLEFAEVLAKASS
jgi:transcriptional regulator with XRE-family HTH domain